jgi:hypothetical protein
MVKALDSEMQLASFGRALSANIHIDNVTGYSVFGRSPGLASTAFHFTSFIGSMKFASPDEFRSSKLHTNRAGVPKAAIAHG